jgi:hypothetical protein
VKYKTKNDRVIVTLPLTTPSGKVRVKRPVAGHVADPVASRREPLTEDDYLEWQISYDTDSPDKPSVLRSVKLNKPKGVRYGYELVRLLFETKKIGILPNTRFKELRQLVFTPLNAGIEELEKITKNDDSKAKTVATKFGFSRHYLHVPNYFRVADSYAVEIKITHKQKAIGNQAMVYVNLPLKYCKSQNKQPLIGRCANKLEKAICGIFPLVQVGQTSRFVFVSLVF